MTNPATLNASAVQNDNYGEIAAIERVLKSSFGKPDTSIAKSETKYIDISSDTGVDVEDIAKPCLDLDHHVSLIDVTGPAAAAIVEFTDCSGAPFADLFVLQKRNNQWAISRKVWDSHAHA